MRSPTRMLLSYRVSVFVMYESTMQLSGKMSACSLAASTLRWICSTMPLSLKRRTARHLQWVHFVPFSFQRAIRLHDWLKAVLVSIVNSGSTFYFGRWALSPRNSVVVSRTFYYCEWFRSYNETSTWSSWARAALVNHTYSSRFPRTRI